MLACLPRPGDLSLQLLPHTQMNTGLQKWDTTQRMKSAQYPTPAELDAYAKKVANNPLTIKIFPNSVKVPQRNHVRRTVNGLDTSGQRYSPYPPSQASVKAGLLAIVKAPLAKGIVKDFDGSRARLHSEVIMNPPAGPYAASSASTLTLHHPPGGHGPRRACPPPPDSTNAAGPSARPGPQTTTPFIPAPPPPDYVVPPPCPGTPPAPSPPPPAAAPPAAPSRAAGGRKLPDGDVPPNVTVSTSTIPLSMAAGLHQGRQADLSTIVHQINQFCQARAQGASATSMCEGQIANPSPISRNLLINASSRVSMHSSGPNGPGLPPHNCVMGPADNAAAPVGHPPPNMAAMNRMPVYHNDIKQHHQQQLQQQHHHHQQQQHHHHQQQQQQQHQQQQHNHQQQQQMRSWNQHHLAQLQHMQDGGGHPCKHPPREAGFPCKGLGYPPELCVGQPYTLKPPLEKPTPSPPVNNNGMAGAMAHYTNGHYFQPHIWNSSILPTPNSDSSGSQDLAMPFHGGNPGGATTLDCAPPGGGHYRPGTGSSGQTNLMQTADYLGGDFQTPCFRDQNLGLMGKMHRPPMNRVGPEAGDGRPSHVQHPGYR